MILQPILKVKVFLNNINDIVSVNVADIKKGERYDDA